MSEPEHKIIVFAQCSCGFERTGSASSVHGAIGGHIGGVTKRKMKKEIAGDTKK